MFCCVNCETSMELPRATQITADACRGMSALQRAAYKARNCPRKSRSTRASTLHVTCMLPQQTPQSALLQCSNHLIAMRTGSVVRQPHATSHRSRLVASANARLTLASRKRTGPTTRGPQVQYVSPALALLSSCLGWRLVALWDEQLPSPN